MQERKCNGKYRSPHFINNSPLTKGMNDLLLNKIKYFTSTVGRTSRFRLAVSTIQTIKCLARKEI
jgi:hypothetical protein